MADTSISGLTAAATPPAFTDIFSGLLAGANRKFTLAQILAGLQGDGSLTTHSGFRGIPQRLSNADTTIVVTDGGLHIFHSAADSTARTYTLPSNASLALPVGFALSFFNQWGAGAVSIAIASDTMRLSPGGTTGTRLLAPGGQATAYKVLATEWMISGNALT